MKVFISWSGERSHAIASALHDWLPSVIQTVETWISDEDIEKGARWSAKLAAELEQTQVGILCLTPDNLKAPWLLFEAGALSKIQRDTYVCTLLFELEPADLQGPLAQFQSTKAHKEDLRKLVHTMNKAQGEKAIPVKQVDVAFDRGWKELNELIQNIPSLQVDAKAKRSDSDMIEEILELVRAQSRRNETFNLGGKVPLPRFPSTSNWAPEDDQMLYEHYLNVKKHGGNKELQHLDKLRKDPNYAYETLQLIKLARDPLSR